MYPSEKRLKFSAQFSGSPSPKLSVSNTTDQVVRSGLIAMESASLEEQEPENKTDNFGRFSLEGAAVNWMMKCDG